MFDYTLIAGVALFGLMVKLSSTTNVRPLTAALLTVLPYFALSILIAYISMPAIGMSLWSLITTYAIIEMVLQIVIAFIVFKNLEKTDEDYSSWMLWIFIGLAGIFLIAPYLAGLTSNLI